MLNQNKKKHISILVNKCQTNFDKNVFRKTENCEKDLKNYSQGPCISVDQISGHIFNLQMIKIHVTTTKITISNPKRNFFL
jgi:hypothetical protein